MISDAELLEAWRGGDAQAGKRIFARYYDAVARFFRNKAGDDASDLVQATFLACVEGAERYRGEGSFRSWLFAVAYRVMCKHYRRRFADQARFDLGSVSVHDLDPTPSRVAVQREEQRILLEALRRIPIEYQVALELHYWEQMPASEIAAALDAPLGTMKSRIRRGRELVHSQLVALSTTPRILGSTVADLDDWAAAVRAEAMGGGCEKKLDGD